MLPDLLVITAAPEFMPAALQELVGAEFALQMPLGADAALVRAVNGVRSPHDPCAASVFVRHCHPVQQVLAAPLAELDGWLHAAASLLPPHRDSSFAVQLRLLTPLTLQAGELAAQLSAMIGQRYKLPMDRRAPEQVLSIGLSSLDAIGAEHRDRLAALGVNVEQSDELLLGFAGWSTPSQNRSAWPGGMQRFSRSEARISRSEFKLLEALAVFNVELPVTGEALDLGAAPGGWSRVLLTAGLRVTAVDPAGLDPRLVAGAGTIARVGDRASIDSNAARYAPALHHARTSAQTFFEQHRGPRYAVIVNDMRMDARDSAALMTEVLDYLADDGLALLTLKLPERQWQPVLDDALARLRRAFRVVVARHLFHNRQEVTVLLRP